MPDKTKRPYVPVTEEELKEIKHEAIEEGEKSGAYMLKRMRLGRIVERVFGKTLGSYLLGLFEYLFGEYDREDVIKALRGETPDIEAIGSEIVAAGKGLTLKQFHVRLKGMKVACKEGKRLIDSREDKINETLDDLEHWIEEFGEDYPFDRILEEKKV